MGYSQRNWACQASELAVLVLCCLVILLPSTSGYYLVKKNAGKTVAGDVACASHPRNCPLIRKRNMQTQRLSYGDVSDAEQESRTELSGPSVPERFRKNLMELLSSSEQSYDTGDKAEVW